MKRGRPFEPGNKFGRGRPKGSRNKKPQALKLFDDNKTALVAMGINKSLEDPSTLRMLIRHALPRPKEGPVKIGKLPMKTLEDLDRASEVTLERVTAGKISPADAERLLGLIDRRRQILVTRDVERRVSALEDRQAGEEE